MKKKQIYLLYLIQFFKQAAMWIAVVEIPVYLAQKDAIGGMSVSHTQKGLVFFFWVFFQNITNIIFGLYADKISLKKSLIISHLFLALGYFIIVIADSYYFFISSVVFLGIGTGMFKLCVEGSLAYYSDENTSHKVWSNFILFINVAVILSTLLLIYLEKISYQVTFLASVVLILCNIPLIFMLVDKEKYTENKSKISALLSFKELLLNKKLTYLILIMTGFTLIYIQFYEMLPNYIFDWINTSNVVTALNLPDFMTSQTSNGRMLSYQIIYLLTSVLVILFINPISHLLRNYNKFNSLIFAMILVALGCLSISFSQLALFLFIGLTVYTFGEMIVRPKFQEVVSDLSPKKRESQYLSFLHISYALGYMIGALSGGLVYDNFGEKARLAQIELESKFGITESIENAFLTLSDKLNITPQETTDLLFNNYNPLNAWLPFIGILIISIILLYFYKKKFN